MTGESSLRLIGRISTLPIATLPAIRPQEERVSSLLELEGGSRKNFLENFLEEEVT